ncbi:hypothetical protein MUDAN_DOGOELCO_00275 [Lactiplantibacillus mudanjiangensis]|nr:hypothetical protein [Lactiplantibacillus mudanjiangensis]VDG30774.1 hypothetical protein MUDAN_DOGOELCO_00275 [Lactiplantibacillus mudanjiangensis]
MVDQDHIAMVLGDNGKLKVILRDEVAANREEKVGVFSVMFLTHDA